MRQLRNLRRSTIFRITVVFVLILLGAIFFMGGFIYWSTVGFMDRQTNTVIETDIEGLADVYRRDGLSGLVATIKARIERDPARSSIYLVANRHRVPVIGNISAWPDVAADQAGWLEFKLTDQVADTTTLARARPFLLRGEVNILVGRDIRNLQEVKRLIERSLIWAMVIAMVVGGFAGLAFTRRVGRRLDMISQTSRSVMRGNLGQRVPILGNGDDLDELARGLNAMLDKIQQLMSGIEHVTDNIAHDLRTPLSRLRNRLAQLGAQAYRNQQQSTSIDRCLKEVDQLLATFSALLSIAKLEAGGPGKNFCAVDLQEIVLAAIELYEPLIVDRGLVLRCDLQPVTVSGDRDLLLQAVCNLLDNAIKFSAQASHIDVELQDQGARATLVIADRGTGISSDDTERVFERFYRGQRSRHTEGAGLGLSMVKAICAHHEALVSLQDNDPGLRVLVSFLRARQSQIAAA